MLQVPCRVGPGGKVGWDGVRWQSRSSSRREDSGETCIEAFEKRDKFESEKPRKQGRRHMGAGK